MKLDPLTAQLVRSSLHYASEEMGIALRNSSYSPNIKERMDHSAALFDTERRLLAQAEHIPVHLGSLPWGLNNIVQYCEEYGIELEDGSMIVANNPYIAGTHLNDVTVIMPIHFQGKLIAYAANKAHHSDIGGLVPGSISIDATSLYEEGLVVNPTYLMKKGKLVKDTISFFASQSRMPIERAGDLKAQAAANVTGRRRVLEIVKEYGLRAFQEAAVDSFEYSKRMIVSRVSRLEQGRFSAMDYLEGPMGEEIKLKVTITVKRRSMEFDYTGTDRELSNPLNSVYGVTLSGVHYVVRTLLGDDLPANHGTFSSLKVRVPEGTVLNPTFPHPVAAGNTETSQRNADLLYRAFAKAIPSLVPAAAGGSMNNVMFGGVHNNKTWAYYETIGVGLGGKQGQDGIDGIQANMTNTMNTPIEDIERTLPIRVTKYEFRKDSSGAGEFRGGSGLIREFEVTATNPVTFTLVSERFRNSPWGLVGGLPGARTMAFVSSRSTQASGKKSSRRVKVSGKATFVLSVGDRFEINTAGGGGHGRPSKRRLSYIAKDFENGLLSKEYIERYYQVQISAEPPA
jgi:N-methylhydantoinase B